MQIYLSKGMFYVIVLCRYVLVRYQAFGLKRFYYCLSIIFMDIFTVVEFLI